MRRRAALPSLLLAALLCAPPARASVEQFATFDPFAVEMDDESAIDHYLSRTPDEWRGEWENAPNALRADQGCLTSAAWYQANEFKARSPFSSRSWLDIGFLQRTDLESSWQWLQFDLHHATSHLGTLGLRVRPAYDKSTQDFALLWDGGTAATPLQGRLTLTLEDTFNTFWEFKQERVGNHAEPYVKHPFEPAFAGVWRGPRHRLEVSSTWLTPSRKNVVDPDPALTGRSALWGSTSRIAAERTFGAQQLLGAFEDQQVRTARTLGTLPGDGRGFRRQWSAELAVRRALGPRWRVEGRYVYQDRDADWRPPVGDARFHALDRIGALEVDWRAHPDWLIRTGLLYDRIGISSAGVLPGFTYGSRKESRAFYGFQARLGKVQVQVVEGIELDAEPYSVTVHHDKAFLHLQTSF